jgi:hypothetical protein
MSVGVDLPYNKDEVCLTHRYETTFVYVSVGDGAWRFSQIAVLV